MNGADLLFIVFALVLMLAVESYVSWRRYDRRRRSDRRIHLLLVRMADR